MARRQHHVGRHRAIEHDEAHRGRKPAQVFERGTSAEGRADEIDPLGL
jgi:hypothetical protein